jgi:hypothetical protein
MDRHDRKPKKHRTDEPDPDLMTHIRSLGLSTVQDYVGWCAQHGFSRRTDKHWRVRLKERSYANRAIADARLAQKKQGPRRSSRGSSTTNSTRMKSPFSLDEARSPSRLPHPGTARTA